MAEQWQIDLALMAGTAYQSSRPDENKFPIPDSWQKTSFWHSTNNSSGFEAVSFMKGNDIVIAFAGTNPNDPNFNDILADIALGLSNFDNQLFDAAQYYLQIKALYPDAKM